jgi:hypothetical protein
MIICSIHYNRPEYSKRCVEYLQRVRGIKDVRLFFQIDRSDKTHQIKEIIQEANFKHCTINVHQSRVRIGENKKSAMAYGFEHSDEVILVEDDVIVSYDFLEYFEKMFKNFEESDNIFNILAFNKLDSNDINKAFLKTIYKTTIPLLCGCWGIWRRSWDKLVENNWTGKDVSFWEIYDDLLAYSISPKVPRMKNIGEISSTGKPCIAHKETIESKYWSNDFDIPNNINWNFDNE